MRSRNRLGFGICAILALGGCSGDSVGEPGDARSDGTADGGENQSFSVIVLLGADDSPLADVSVALDLRGTRTELTTDETGIVRFDGLTFAGATASVTAYRANYGVVSYLGLGPNDPLLQVRTYRLADAGDAPDSILGTAGDMIDPTDPLVVSSTVGLALSTDPSMADSDYEVQVQGATAGRLIALAYEGLSGGGPRDLTLDLKQWAIKDHPAVTGVASVDISFGTDMATQVPVSGGSLVLPARADSPLRTDAGGWFAVYSATATALVGIYETSTLATDASRFDIVGEYVDPGTDFEPQTNYILRFEMGMATLEQSIVTQFAWPEDGFEISNFLDAPEITSSLKLHPLHDEITWIQHEASTLAVVRISRPDGAGLMRIWDVYAPGDATSAAIPELPSSADETDVLGPDLLSARVESCDLDDDLQICVRRGTSRPIELIQ